MSKRKVASLLRKAAQVIEKYGWVQGKLGYVDTGFCALGAINHATNDGGDEMQGYKLAALAKEALKNRVGGIATYNDVHCTSPREVTSLMRRTARELEHGGSL